MVKVDLGCSFHKREGYIGVDVLPAAGVDVRADVCRLPFRDNSVDEIYSSYMLEHVACQLEALREIYRVCRPGAKVRLIIPHFSNPAFYDDLTHKQLYSTRSFEHYDHDLHALTGHPNYLPEVNLKVLRAQLRWWPPQVIARKSFLKRLLLRVADALISGLANLHPFLCERIWCRWVGGFYEVDFLLEVRK